MVGIIDLQTFVQLSDSLEKEPPGSGWKVKWGQGCAKWGKGKSFPS